MARRSEIRLEHTFGTDDLCDVHAVELPLTPRPGTTPVTGCPVHEPWNHAERFRLMN